MNYEQFGHYVEIVLEEYEKGDFDFMQYPESHIIKLFQNYLEKRKHPQAE
jgi:hypothetical protein